jgi:hypothetical protein
MNLTENEKKIIVDALKVYAQIMRQQNAPAATQAGMMTVIQSIIKKTTEPEVTGEQKLKGLTDEEFDNVCLKCDKFKNQCTDAIAKKYPGKCDPILHYHQSAKEGWNSQANEGPSEGV